MSKLDKSNNDRNTVDMVSRRSVVKTFAVGGALAAFGGLPLALGTSRPSYAGELTKVRLAWAEPASCHAPLAFGIEKGLFRKQGIDLQLTYHGIVGGDQIKAMETGETDMGSHLLIDWLKPIHDMKSNVKVIAGTHDGCQRLLTSQASKIASVAELKGKTIAVGQIDDVAYKAFLVTLSKSGLDPHKDVKWIGIPYEKLGEAVNSGQADALATLDALAYLNKKQYNLRELANTQTGHYHNTVCCVLGASGDFLRNNREAVRRATSAVFDAYDYATVMPMEVAEFYINKYKPGYSVGELVTVLAALPLRRHPMGGELARQAALAIDDMKEVRVLSSNINTDKFTAQIVDNIMA